MGPIEIEIIGYDSIDNILYYSQSNWSEVSDAGTTLFKYDIKRNNNEIIEKWDGCYFYKKNRDSILISKRLYSLSKLIEKTNNDVYELFWQTEIRYYDKVIMKDTLKYPFIIRVNQDSYSFIVCRDKTQPKIKIFELANDIGVIVVNYKYDCFEGNVGDMIIFYNVRYKNEFSRKLI